MTTHSAAPPTTAAPLTQQSLFRGAERPRVLLIGLGTLGSYVLNEIVRLPHEPHLIVAGPTEASLRELANLSVLSAMQTNGRAVGVDVVHLDLCDVDTTSETLTQVQPDVIVNCATLQPYSEIEELSPAHRRQLDAAGLGPWLPTHLALAHRLQTAVHAASVSAVVVNCAYPDAVNPALAGAGLAPLAGAGNIANNEPAIRLGLAAQFQVEPSEVSVRMVMHHFVSHRIHRLGDAGGAPFHIYCEIASRDRSDEVDLPALFGEMSTRLRRRQGNKGRLMAASATAALVSALGSERTHVLHAPGPLGLPGGYPVEVGRGGLALRLPPGMSLDEAIQVNERAQVYDGIESIGPDGTVRFSEHSASTFADVLGYNCTELPLVEAFERAVELRTKCAEARETS